MKSAAILFATFAFSSVAQPQQIVVGSKKFTESYVLGEIAKTALENAGFAVEHKQGMGGTIILWQALRSGEIAVY
jgi:osmoprotectant transport system permease protein